MRTIRITEEEVATIKTALQIAYNKCLDPIQANRTLFGDDAINAMLARAHSFWEAQDIFDGERDVELKELTESIKHKHMKSYYIDCRELTEEQVGEVCNELERLGYKVERRLDDCAYICTYDDGEYWMHFSYLEPYQDDIVITLEELKAL